MAKSDILVLIILFIAIALMAFATITAISKIDRADVNETPELAAEQEEQEAISQPFYFSMNALIVGILACIFLAGIAFILGKIRKSMRGGF